MIELKGIENMIMDKWTCEEPQELLYEMSEQEIKALLQYYKSKDPSDPRIAFIEEKTSL